MRATNKRINFYGHAVFDIYRDQFFLATVELRGDAPRGLKILLGTMTPAGKEVAWEAIRRYEGVA